MKIHKIEKPEVTKIINHENYKLWKYVNYEN